MITRAYEIKDAQIVSAQLEPDASADDPLGYSVVFLVPEAQAQDIIGLQKIVSTEQFGKVYPVERMSLEKGVWHVMANSRDRPKISGLPNSSSKGLKLNLVKQATIKLEVWGYATNFGKGVALQLKELIF